MFTPRSIIPVLLIGGLVVIEVLAGNPLTNSAQSQRQLNQNETDLILSILHGEKTADDSLPSSSFPFIDFNLPDDPGTVAGDTQTSFGTVVGIPTTGPTASSPYTPTGSPLNEVLPPMASALFYAYQDGGVAWYSKGSNVLVIFPNETIRSFDKSTGTENDWLQDKLAQLPITDAGAYTNYQSSYKAKIVAETRTWVLMEFPSGGVLKVGKPQYSSPIGGSILGLPNILPNSSP